MCRTAPKNGKLKKTYKTENGKKSSRYGSRSRIIAKTLSYWVRFASHFLIKPQRISAFLCWNAIRDKSKIEKRYAFRYDSVFFQSLNRDKSFKKKRWSALRYAHGAEFGPLLYFHSTSIQVLNSENLVKESAAFLPTRIKYIWFAFERTWIFNQLLGKFTLSNINWLN